MAQQVLVPELAKIADRRQDEAVKTIDAFLKGVKKLTKKTRYLSIGISNDTGQTLRLVDSTFDSGRYWDQPDPEISTRSIEAFGICNVDGGFMTGVSMHCTFEIGRTGCFLGIGLSSPYSGSYKTKCYMSDKKNAGSQAWKKMNDNPGTDNYSAYAVKWHRTKNTRVTIIVAGASK